MVTQLSKHEKDTISDRDEAIPRHEESYPEKLPTRRVLSVLVQQLDREKRLAFNCLSAKKEAFVRETVKRSLSLPVMGKTHHIEEISADCFRLKSFSFNEGKGTPFSLHSPGKLILHPSLQRSNSYQEKIGNNASLLSVKKRRDSSSKASDSDITSFTGPNSDIGRLLSLKAKHERQNLQTRRQIFKPGSLSLADAPSFNEKLTKLKRRVNERCLIYRQPAFNL